jgi:hypothetical protein
VRCAHNGVEALDTITGRQDNVTHGRR